MPRRSASFVFLLYASFSFGCISIDCLSLDEKVGQLLMAQFHGETVNEEARALIQDTKIGGFIYYNWANGLSSPEQVRSLSEGVQILSLQNPHPIPLFIAIDQEGGGVARLKQGFTEFPGNRAMGEAGDLELAESVGFAMAQELKAAGVNMNLAPVVDVNCNPRNPVIGIRSFSDDPKVVAAFGRSVLKGHKEAGVIATLKHFPGHGDTSIDSHEDLPLIGKSIDQLKEMEFFPFAELADAADAIMTAHILIPAIDPEHSATLSRKTIDYLRKNIGFKGLVVSDSLVMEGVLKKCGSLDEAAIQALVAGCDLLILGGKLLAGERKGFELQMGDIQKIHRTIVDAVKKGRILESRIDEAVKRILDLKHRSDLCRERKLSLEDVVSTDAHKALSEKVSRLALKWVCGGDDWRDPLQEKKVAVFSPSSLQETIQKTSLLKLGKRARLYLFPPSHPTDFEIQSLKESLSESDLLIVCSYNAWKNPVQKMWVESCLDTEKPVILFVLGDPIDGSLFPKANRVYLTFSPTSASIEAASRQLAQD